MRTYRCPDCPPDAGEHIAGTRGPLPQYCPVHRRARELRRDRRGHSPSRTVPPQSEPEQDVPARGSIRQALADDLAAITSSHPAAATLGRIAEALAWVLDNPAVLVADPRIGPTLSRELRSIITELVTATDAEDDDLFGGWAGPIPQDQD
jgi:hypothetical protein